MFKKSTKILKENPVLILFYVGYLFIVGLIMITLYPRDMSRFYATDTFDFAAYISMMIKSITASILMGVIGLLFTCGYGNMIKEAVKNGKTLAGSFLPGIKKYFVRILLALLLLLAFTMVFSIVLSVITVPIMLLTSMQWAGAGTINTDAFIPVVMIITLITFAIVLFVVPLVLLWTPAIFVDDIGVIRGLTSGFKAGVKNYWKLILLMIIIYLPIGVYMFLEMNTLINGRVLSPGLIVCYVIEAVIGILMLPILFIIYKEYSEKYNTIP